MSGIAGSAYLDAQDALAQVRDALEAANGTSSRHTPIPNGFLWDTPLYPISPSIVERSAGGRSQGALGYDPFTGAAYLACVNGAQYYVAYNGSDSNAGTSAGAALLTIDKAVQLANAGGVPAAINLIGSSSINYLGRVGSAAFSTTKPTVDLLIRSNTNQRVILGTFDIGANTWTANGTYAWVYQTNRTNALRILNPAVQTEDGLYTDYVKVASLAVCAQNPGSWYTDGTVVYVNPFFGQTLNDGTARILLNAPVFNWSLSGSNALVNVFLDSIDVIGGVNGALVVFVGAPSVSWPNRIFAARNCTFRYGGAVSGTGGVYINGWPGLCYSENCDASGSADDNWNYHNGIPTYATMHVAQVNCTASDSGRGGYGVVSCNGLTGHDSNLIVIDIAGNYRNSRGRTVHFVGSSQLWSVGTIAAKSRGDLGAGGSFTPAEFYVDDTAKMWLDGVQPLPALQGNYGILAGGTGVTNVRNLPAVATTRAISGGSIAAY